MPEDDSLHQPHDKLFKASFRDPVNAAASLRWEFSPAISEKIGWKQLRLEPGSFIDSQYRHCESDLLFSAPLAGADSDCLIYVLFEHQTTLDRRLALRLLSYMVRIWESHLQTIPSASGLPVILPVVLAQNAEVWDLSPRFRSLLNFPEDLESELDPFVPDFVFRLIQLAGLPFDAIRGTPAGIMTLRVMKAERSASLLDDMVWDEALLVELPRETLELLIRYMLGAEIDKAAFDGKVREIRQSQLQSTTMTLADQLREEGLQKGLQFIHESILETLEIRFGEIPDGLRETITGIQDLGRLRSLHKASVQSATLDEFTKSL